MMDMERTEKEREVRRFLRWMFESVVALVLLLIVINLLVPKAEAQLEGGDDVFGDGGMESLLWVDGVADWTPPNYPSACGQGGSDFKRCCTKFVNGVVQCYRKAEDGSWDADTMHMPGDYQNPRQSACDVGICFGNVWTGKLWKDWTPGSGIGHTNFGGCGTTWYGCRPSGTGSFLLEIDNELLLAFMLRPEEVWLWA